MARSEYFENQLKRAYTILQSYWFKVDGRMSPNKFTKKSKLGFAETCLFILRGTKRSLQAAIYTFLRESKAEWESYSKQAFSQRRQYIKPEAFLTLFRSITENFYTEPFKITKTFCGLHLFAIDGTTYTLENTSELKEIYGVQTSNGEPQTLAKGSCLYDVLNGLLVDVRMLPIKTSEQEIAKEHLRYLCGIKPTGNLVLMDRGYPSMDLIQFCEENHLFYLMRCNKNEFIAEVRRAMKPDQILNVDRHFCHTKEKFKASIRVIQFNLDNGVNETLITNLLDSSFSIEDFKYLYHLRWGIEEKYDELKNKLRIEAFSGITPIAVLQDFYATMFLTNLVAYAEMDCEPELALTNEDLKKKYEYRINNTQAIAAVKDSFIALVMEANPRKQAHAFKRLHKRILLSTVPIRPRRTFQRICKHKSSKYPNNRKIV